MLKRIRDLNERVGEMRPAQLSMYTTLLLSEEMEGAFFDTNDALD